MFKILFIRELQGYIYSLRFQISFVIVLLVFIIGTVSYLMSLNETRENYTKLMQYERNVLEGRAENATEVAVREINYYISPKDNNLIDNSKENLLPNHFIYSAYNVFGFDIRYDSNNPFMKQVQDLNWAFIVSMIISFVTLLFAFDAVSGEKEDRTLSLVFSNAVSRGNYIFSKLLGIVSISFCMVLVGVIVSIIIVAFSGNILLDQQFLFETAGFLFTGFLFIAVMSAIGLMASTLSKQSNISLLVCLFIWLFFTVVLPNSSVFFADKIFPIPTAQEIQTTILQEQEDINENAPSGAWNWNFNNPFFENHKLRADNQTNIMTAEKRHKDAYYADMFRQFENIRMFNIISPVAQFEYMNESVVGNGYVRFQKNWSDLHVFQQSFLQWFKDLDSKDAKSPHWYNPFDNISTTRLPVSVNTIPVYVEQQSSFSDRIGFMRNYLIAVFVLIGGIFAFCFVRFLKYDVR